MRRISVLAPVGLLVMVSLIIGEPGLAMVVTGLFAWECI